MSGGRARMAGDLENNLFYSGLFFGAERLFPFFNFVLANKNNRILDLLKQNFIFVLITTNLCLIMKKSLLLTSALIFSFGSLFAQSTTAKKTSDTTKTKKMHRAKFSDTKSDKKDGTKDSTKPKKKHRSAF